MHRGPPHIPRIFPLKRAGAGAVHDTRVIPRDQVSGILPLHLQHVLGLLGVGVQLLEEIPALGLGQALDVVDVRGDVQIGAAGGLVPLHETVPAEGVVLGHDVREEVRRGASPAVPQAVRGDVVVLDEPRFQVRLQLIPRRARVRVQRVSARALGWQFVGPEQRVACSPGVEARVHVEDAVCLERRAKINKKIKKSNPEGTEENYLVPITPHIPHGEHTPI